ncbi:enoyl-CoA hydratase/isomerase family protein [Mycobacterium xenopi 4042]|uniref:Enoyl-CoA hydratase/isomerase family protein n=1 Tax=Mycobacterium xenopi 4042 TaxID=1299334 RepID=X7ZXW9_MYCXE|nr:enoyl-CoA hydratase/isomerase family protein [Mycobacterium xenopi 4042]
MIAAMQGHAIGGGLQLALGADIRIVTADIVIACAEIDFGMTVDMGGSQLLPRLIGPTGLWTCLFPVDESPACKPTHGVWLPGSATIRYRRPLNLPAGSLSATDKRS